MAEYMAKSTDGEPFLYLEASGKNFVPTRIVQMGDASDTADYAREMAAQGCTVVMIAARMGAYNYVVRLDGVEEEDAVRLSSLDTVLAAARERNANARRRAEASEEP